MFRQTSLENGICVVTETIPSARSLSLGILVDASPRDEGPRQQGLAHLAEHALFQGTGSRDAVEIARAMDLAGGNLGAFTTRDYTLFHASVLDDYAPYVIDLLGDLLLNSVYPEEAIANEKRAIAREIGLRADDPLGSLHDRLKELAWPGHSLGQPIAGSLETVGGLTREDVIYFVHRHYLPDRIVVAAAGNLDHDDFVAHLRDAFWRLIGTSGRVRRPAPEWVGGVRGEVRELSQAYFALGLPGIAFGAKDRYASYVLNAVLGGGISSRLFRRLREDDGLVYHVASEIHAYADAGLFAIEGVTSPDALATVLDRVSAEIDDLATTPIPEDELWKVKMQLRGQHCLSGESTHTRMSRLATQQYYLGRPMVDAEVLAAFEAVDADAICRAAQAWANGLAQPALAAVGPEGVGESELEEALARFRSREPAAA